MKMKRKVIAVVIMLIMAMQAVGCGKKQETGQNFTEEAAVNVESQDEENVQSGPQVEIEVKFVPWEEAGLEDHVMDWKDENLEAGMLELLGRDISEENDEKEIMLSEVWELTSIEIQREVSDISSLSELTNLTELNLYTNRISDISSLSSLTNLTKLHLSSWYDTIDISSLSGLTNLTVLWLDTFIIDDISSLSGLTNLTELYLPIDAISDISSLSGLTNLTRLRLEENDISDISSLSGLTNLEYLCLSGNPINDISDLSSLTNLQYLSLTEDSVSDSQIESLEANGVSVELFKYY